MKKYNLVIIFVLLLALALAGCAGREDEPKQKEPITTEKYEDKKEQGQQDKSQQQNEGETNAVNDGSEDGNDKLEGEEGQTDTESESENDDLSLNPHTVTHMQEEVVTTSSVNVRKAPSTDSEVYQTVPRRSNFTRTADDGTWSAVQIGDNEYYIASEFLMLASEVTDNGYLVVIDAGHQAQGNSEQEPIGPL